MEFAGRIQIFAMQASIYGKENMKYFFLIRKLLASAVFFGISTAASAVMTVGDFRAAQKAPKDDPNRTAILMYLYGAASAFHIANLEVQQRGHPPLYCRPSMLRLNGSNYWDLVDQALKTRRNSTLSNDTQLSMVLVSELMDAFPCFNSHPQNPIKQE